MVAQGKTFTVDPRIVGNVEACRRFLRENVTNIVGVEQIVASVLHQYAGTLDLQAIIDGRRVIVDYKATIDEDMVALQLGGYSLALRSEEYQPRYGIGVELHEDGTYKTTKLIDLSLWRSKFAACRTVFGMRKDFGLLQLKSDEPEGKE